jgi:hypothetical protein
MKKDLVYTTGIRSELAEISKKLDIIKAENLQAIADNKIIRDEIAAQLSGK